MRAKCNDDLSTVNFSTIGLDVHKNRLVACAVHVQHDAKGREVHEPENRGIYTQSDSPKKSSRNIWSLAVVSVDQRY